jgi:hypothetical protein
MLQRRQDMFGVSTRARVTAIASPVEPDVQYVSGSRVRAAGSTTLAGVAVTALLTWGADRVLGARQRRRRTVAGEDRLSHSDPAPAPS